MKASKQIKMHPNFNADDFAYLTAKGWTETEILKRWSQEYAAGRSACRWDDPIAQRKLKNVKRRYGVR